MDYEKKYFFLVKELEERGLTIDYRPIIIKNTDKEIIASPTKTNPKSWKRKVGELTPTDHERRTKRERAYAIKYKQKPAKCDECGLEDKMEAIINHQNKTNHKRKHLIGNNRKSPHKPETKSNTAREETSSMEEKSSPSLLERITRGNE